MFQEMQVTTGGADAQQATAGVQMNFVLKSGTNTPHGSARTYYENKNLQASNVPADLVGALGGVSGKGNRLTKYADYGGELGGPIVKDRLWGWGSLGRTDVNIQTLAGYPDKTTLENVGAKGSAAFTQALRGNFTFFSGNKKKDGRGAGPDNPPETTWIQNGPSKMYKGEVSYVASNTLFVTARGAHVNGPFSLTPKGGLDKQVFIDADSVFHNTNLFTSTDRPQVVFNGDGSWFRGRHEVKFGASARRYTDDTSVRYGGDFEDVELDADTGLTEAIAIRPYHQVNHALYTSLFAGDTISLDRLTINAALRFDRATSSTDAIHLDAHAIVPQDLPAVDAPAVKDAVVWNTWSPRVGVTYAIGASRRTIGRASYSSFAGQLNAAVAGNISAASYAYSYYLAVDRNHDFEIAPDELGRFLGARNIIASNPTQPVNQIDPSYRAPRTHEIAVGIDHELMPNVGVSATYTWRRFVHQLWNVAPPIGATTADYAVDGFIDATLPDGTVVHQPFYALSEAATPLGNGTLTANREGYHRSFNGVEVSATKRLANRWMGRFGFPWNSEKEYFDDPSRSIVDPTPLTSDPLVNGATVTVPTAGSGKSQIYLTLPKYQFIANGYYQGPWCVNVGANWTLRQGYSEMFFADNTPIDETVYGLKDVLVVGNKVGHYRLPNVSILDARFEKQLTFGARHLSFDVDVFNLLNSGTVLGRKYNVNTKNFNAITEITNPRIVRFGIRFGF